MILAVISAVAASCVGDPGPAIQLAGKWQVRVMPQEVRAGGRRVTIGEPVTFRVDAAPIVRVRDERYDKLPLFNAQGPEWAKGFRIFGVRNAEITEPGLLDPGSLRVKSGPGNAAAYVLGKDYQLDGKWGQFGRLEGGSIPENGSIWLDYDHGIGRVDSIFVDASGKVTLRKGKPVVSIPVPPEAKAGEKRLANIWVEGRLPALKQDSLYPVIEESYPVPKHEGPPPAAALLPKTWAKLQSGQKVTIIAWGDSVTAGGNTSDDAHRYQHQFLDLLRKRFPKADIQLTTVAWGGRTSDNFLNEPPGSQYNFKEKVLDARADLIVMEFVNDAWMKPEDVRKKYAYLQERFEEVGSEWVILTPHFVKPDWMGKDTPRLNTDPRPYVAGLRQFAWENKVALADASLRWGHLLQEGIPYPTLLANSINHPDDRGHQLFALSLMELFQ